MIYMIYYNSEIHFQQHFVKLKTVDYRIRLLQVLDKCVIFHNITVLNA